MLWLERARGGEGAESKPEPIIPLCLLRLQTAQIPREAHPAAVALICQSSSSPSLGGGGGGGGELWYAVRQLSLPLPCFALVNTESSVKGRPLRSVHL